MADAVLRERLVVGAAALAGLFLVVLLLVVAFWLLATIADRLRQANATCEQILTETAAPAPTRAVRDTEPGINLADQDACELIWDMPALQPSALRFRAIRDEQQKGETA